MENDSHLKFFISYSPKYKAYEQDVRKHQIERAQKLIHSTNIKRKGKNQNDPLRFVKQTAITGDGELAQLTTYEIDEERIAEEAKYDGYYAVITNLEDDVEGILKINKQRWEIEENFRIMKTDFEARPVYVRREDRIKPGCYESKQIFRW